MAGASGSGIPGGGLGGRALQRRGAGPRKEWGPSRVRPADSRGPAGWFLVCSQDGEGRRRGRRRGAGRRAATGRPGPLGRAGFPRPSSPRRAAIWLKPSLLFSGRWTHFFYRYGRSAPQCASSLLSSSVLEGGEISDFPICSAETVSGSGRMRDL